jgi:NADPH:quinone reductase-like Zn-dependent oxidoreductase
MKAIVQTKFGTPADLELQDLEKPVPKKGQLLIKIHAASANAYDWRHVRAEPTLIRFMGGGLFKPKHPVLGADMAGKVEAVGPGVESFNVGDAVFGEGGYGGFAEYAAVEADRFVKKPGNITFEEAAAAPMAALTALQGMRDSGKLQKGLKLLVNGASGGVGSYALQIGKAFEMEVTGVCSTSKTDLLETMGADHIFDYKKENILDSGKSFDLIFDSAAYRPASSIKKILNPKGMYVIAGGAVGNIFGSMFKRSLGAKWIDVVVAKANQDDLNSIADMLEKGQIRSMIHKTFPLERTAEALQLLYEGGVRGKVVIVP